MELATADYLEKQLDVQPIAADVRAAINKPMYPRNYSKLDLNPVDVFYGVEVLEFLIIEAKELGVLTNKIPLNKRTLGLFDRCSVM